MIDKQLVCLIIIYAIAAVGTFALDWQLPGFKQLSSFSKKIDLDQYLIQDYMTYWQLTHFLTRVCLGYFSPKYWYIVFVVDFGWETAEYIKWKAHNWYDLIYNMLGLIVGIMIRYYDLINKILKRKSNNTSNDDQSNNTSVNNTPSNDAGENTMTVENDNNIDISTTKINNNENLGETGFDNKTNNYVISPQTDFRERKSIDQYYDVTQNVAQNVPQDPTSSAVTQNIESIRPNLDGEIIKLNKKHKKKKKKHNKYS